MLIEKRVEGPYGRSYIEGLGAEAALTNAFGTLVSLEDDGAEFPVICLHGGSMWLCQSCKDRLLQSKG